MTENGVRLQYVIDDDSFIITDVLSGHVLAYSKGSYQITTLEPKIALKEIQTLVECYTTAADKFTWKMRKGVSKDDNLRVEHVKHFEWKLTLHGYECNLSTAASVRNKKFEDSWAITRLQWVYSVLLKSQGMIRKPQVDIVRRISDAKLLLWVHDGHTVVHTEESAQGMLMVNCLVDGVAYDCLQVSPSKESGTCGLLTLNGELICDFPLDDSILAYYKTAEEMFD